MTIIEKIVGEKKKQLAKEKRKISSQQLLDAISTISAPPSFSKALAKKRDVSFIFEHKPASPSKGKLSNFEVEKVVAAYDRAGASAISVLAESNFFGGSVENVRHATGATSLPVLFKDFAFDHYHLLQAREAGASAILLMNGVCPGIEKFLQKADELQLECLVECTSASQIASSLESGAKILGINNRDFSTLRTDLNKTAELASLVPSSVLLVSESGVSSPNDVELLSAAGADSILVGSSLMKQKTLKKLEELASGLVRAGKNSRVERK